MFRAICSVVVIVGCFMIGVKASRDLKERLFFIKEMAHCMNLMRIRLEYDAPPCIELLSEIEMKTKNEEVRLLIEKVITSMESNAAMEKAWEEALDFLQKRTTFVKSEEKAAILRLGGLLGSKPQTRPDSRHKQHHGRIGRGIIRDFFNLCVKSEVL